MTLLPSPVVRLRRDRLRAQSYFTAQFPMYIAEVRQESIDEHSHEFYEMVYVRRGRGEHSIEGRTYPIQAGDLYVIHPGEKHSYTPVPGSHLHIINLLWMPSLVKDLLESGELPAQSTLNPERGLSYIEPFLRRGKGSKHESARKFNHRLHLSGRMAYRVESLLDEIRREQTVAAPGAQLLQRYLFCALLVLLSRAYEAQTQPPSAAQSTLNAGNIGLNAAGQHATIARAIEWLEEHYAEPIRVRDVAAHAALSESRLAHLFKEHTGRGLIEYLHEYRINRGCARLCETSQPIQEIAGEIGYNDLRFFHRLFRRHTGCNPTQYRQHFGQGEGI
jgi:AraC-like DNA-binding protein/mannose-6-phosphate isomerase-like protein (cupin superfamily)